MPGYSGSDESGTATLLFPELRKNNAPIEQYKTYLGG